MPRMTGGEAVVRSLASEGVRAVFGLPGTHALAMFDALHDAPGIRRITARHEQGAAYMADGYARASRRRGGLPHLDRAGGSQLPLGYGHGLRRLLTGAERLQPDSGIRHWTLEGLLPRCRRSVGHVR